MYWYRVDRVPLAHQLLRGVLKENSLHTQRHLMIMTRP